MSIPVLSKQQLEELDNAYPEKSADPKDDERTIWRKVGQRDVVRRLIQEWTSSQRKS
jgi:hypothetical protein